EATTGTGRWALLDPPAPPPADEVLEARARQYVRRYGVVFRDLLTREPDAPAWRDLLRVYRRLEMRGELRGGRMVGAFVGEQFALPEALETLRSTRRAAPSEQLVKLSACDPLNLTGIITPGPRVPAVPRHTPCSGAIPTWSKRRPAGRGPCSPPFPPRPTGPPGRPPPADPAESPSRRAMLR